MAAKRKTTAAGDDDTLLPDIWRKILNRLPVKSILRCRSVCKSWYSLVSCPNFVSDYSTLNKNEDRVLVQILDEHRPLFSSVDESSMESREHDDVPEEWLGEICLCKYERHDLDIVGPHIVGSCDGLICLCKYETCVPLVRATFLIWNPALRKIVELPCQTINPKHHRYTAFGFDSKTNDYKLLCTGDANVLEVLDLKKGVWRGIMGYSGEKDLYRYPDCYVNGAVHWTGSNTIILSFDMSEECFREIKMPDCAEFTQDDHREVSFQSVAFGGLLYVIVWKEEADVFDDMSKSCSIWAMKEYGVTESWTKVYNVDVLWPYYFRVWGNGQVLMVDNPPVDLVLRNIERGESKVIFSTTRLIIDLHLYKENLFLMCGTG